MRASEFSEDVRMSPRVIIALLAIVVLPVALGSPRIFEARNLQLALLFYALLGALLVLHAWTDEWGRWVTVVTLCAAVVVLRFILPVPGLLTLSALVVVVAGVVVGAPAVAALGAAETVLHVALLFLPAGIPTTEVILSLCMVVATAGFLLWLHHAVSQQVSWFWEHFERHRELLEQARDRQVQLKEALDALSHANRELALANDRLAAMRVAAETARTSKAAFVANVSHELRTPLNIVIGLAEVLLRPRRDGDQPLPPGVREDLAILYRNCEHLSSMISDVLDLSQVEAGRLALRREWVDMSALMSSSLRIVRPLLQQKGLALGIDIHDAIPPVYCDPRRIRQVVLNLLSNAARYTEKGSVTVRAEVQEDTLVVSVADTGPGISEQEARRMFEPFQQGASGVRNGSGLGLSISRQFVELHDGQMWLDSRLGVGSTFYFRLPVTPPPAPLTPASRWVTEGWTERTTRVDGLAGEPQQRLVLCDPSGEAYPVLCRYADKIEFIYAPTPAEALQALEQSSACAVWVNAPTPEELWTLIDEIRAGEPEAPVIGCSLPSRHPSDLYNPRRDFLLKPVLQHHLEEAMHRLHRDVRRALIADDDPDTLYTLTKMLNNRDGDVEIVTATSGAEALAKMRALRPDLVLLDVIMPDMDGWQVLATMAEDEVLRDMPVLVISATDPRDEPISSGLVAATIGEGLSIDQLMRCAQTLADLLLRPA
jgi:signal transduction histidine kinase/CheY-like chemotaxis protein